MRFAAIINQAMRYGYEAGIRRLLFQSFRGDPERIHEAMITWLSKLPKGPTLRSETPYRLAGIDFPRRVGVAAGLDKDGLAAHTWSYCGFGFAELGTVTALPQPGNPSPRLFRLQHSRAIINRMGFNNQGAIALAQRLASRGFLRGSNPIPLGISIGKSKVVDLAHASADYCESLRIVADYADYIAINVSSPNTPGLRSLQDARELYSLLSALRSQAQQCAAVPVPIFVKMAPDLTPRESVEIVKVVEDVGAAGLIATNTTLGRGALHAADEMTGREVGGLSGAPITLLARDRVSRLREATTLPIIGVGGIMSPKDGAAMLAAGADLLQVYTGFIYSGPALVHGINQLK